MNINSKEILLRTTFVAATLFGAACASKSVATPTKPVIATEQSGPPLETPTAMPTVQPKTESGPPHKRSPSAKVPVEIDILITNPQMEKWRKSLEDVSIIDFGPDRYSGRVVSQEDIEIKRLPDIYSESVKSLPSLNHKEVVNFRQLITIRGKVDKQLTESWAVVDEITRKGTMWDCEKGWGRGHGLCFVPVQKGEKEQIDIYIAPPPSADKITFYNWTKK